MMTFALAFAAVSVYTHPLDIAGNPDYNRRAVKPPTDDLFGYRPHFSGLRFLKEGADVKTTLDQMERDHLGDVFWAHYGFLGNKDLDAQLAELKRRNWFVFDIWFGMPRFWVKDRPLFREEVAKVSSVMGDHFLGKNIGEEDGRYVSQLYGYAHCQHPIPKDGVEAYYNFQRHFEYLHWLQGNKVSALISLNYGHYLAKEGCYTMMGAEAAQALPNAQIYYSFLRGLGKQHGIPWYSGISVYNRWGAKGYPEKIEPGQREFIPTAGASLALLQKLLYAEILYGCRILAFEGFWHMKKDGKSVLSPIGRIQSGASRWCEKYGDVGIQHVPVALMFDFFSGWTFPRSTYGNKDVFLNWGVLPWNLGDFFADGVFNEIYPGYQESSYWKDERGFNTDTPYGDIADCVLTDADGWMLRQYPLIILANKMRSSAELAAKLRDYVKAGGTLLYTRGNAKTLFPDGFGETGEGRVVEIPSEWGVVEKPQCALPVRNEVEKELPRPHPLTAEAKEIVNRELAKHQLFALREPEGLSLITCRRSKGEYTIAVLNNTWEEKPMKLTSCAGKVLSVEELKKPEDVRDQIGYAPEIFTNFVCAADRKGYIAPGDVRLFRVRTEEDGVKEIAKVVPKANPTGRVFVLRNHNGPIKEAVLRRPTFFRHYDEIMIDWKYLRARTVEDLEKQKNWIGLQGLKLSVDMRSGLNFWPDLRYSDNVKIQSDLSLEALDDVLKKMNILGAKDVILSPDRYSWYIPDYGNLMRAGMKRWVVRCKEAGVTPHMSNVFWRGVQMDLARTFAMKDLKRDIGEDVLKIAPSFADMVAFQRRHRPDEPENAVVNSMAGLTVFDEADVDYVFLAAPEFDEQDQPVSTTRPLAGAKFAPTAAQMKELVGKLRGKKIVFDAEYPDDDAEWRDVVLVAEDGSAL